ncbi:MAG TPA: transcriptional regulator [Actinomycetota bacterium]|jgi:predicted ArsR family transcriptional regulator|nr:transcriptional regulator [Actinomycetota bacterium]
MNRALESNANLLAVLDDDLRRRIFLFVRAQGLPVSRERVAGEVGISRKLAAFHLDKLVEKGLLTHHYARPAGKGGPGAGRPAKVYEPSPLTIEISVPQRQYELAGRLLLDGVANQTEGTSARESTNDAALARGSELGSRTGTGRGLRHPGPERTLAAAEEILSEQGFEPFRETSKIVALRNCPFHRLAEQSPEVVCGMNRSFIEGIVRGLGNDTVQVVLEPEEGHCCVKLCSPGAG